jgi:hypothetical protein
MMEHYGVFGFSIELERRVVGSFAMAWFRSHRYPSLNLIDLSPSSNQMLNGRIRLFVTAYNSSIFNGPISSWIVGTLASQ